MAWDLTANHQTILPELRDDIQILQLPTNGKTTWQIHDPVQHRFFTISADTKRLLYIWEGGRSIEEMLEIARVRLGYDLDPGGLGKLIEFLEKSNLVQRSQPGSWKKLAQERQKETLSFSRRLLASYLFIRLPLLRPEPVLRRIAPALSLFYSSGFLWGMVLLGIIGTYLSAVGMSQKFTSPFELISGDGLLQIGFSLVILKLVHEWAHAITAYRFGCRVPIMGVAFMVFVPLLYTDVSDAWRLSEKRKRILISAAGMIAEIVVAVIATFLWAFLADGMLREMMFYIATVGWVSSLAFNLNPLMKFDGYYILADLTGIENLQARAFALGRWKLRRWLLFPSLACPESLGQTKTALLICYAFLTWIYRLIVFIGISILLYHFVTKVLGLALLLATLSQLVIMPIFRELKACNSLYSVHGAVTSKARPAILMAIAPLLFFLPLSNSIYIPAVLTEEKLQRVFPPRASRIKEIIVGTDSVVQPGDTLFRFETPELVSKIEKIALEANALKQQLARGVSDRSERREIILLQQELTSLLELQNKLLEEVDQLDIKSANRGKVVQMADGLEPGKWVSANRQLAIVRTGQFPIVRGYVEEDVIDRVSEGDVGRFVPDDPTMESVPVTLSKIASDTAQQIDVLELASIYGGPIAAGKSKTIYPEAAQNQFEVELKPMVETEAPNQLRRGVVVLNGKSVSLAQTLFQRVVAVLTKEMTF